MKVLKFGEASLENENSLKNTIQIVAENYRKGLKLVVVCSAMSGITDELLRIGECAKTGDLDTSIQYFKQIRKKHFQAAEVFRTAETFRYSIEPVFEDLKNLIHGVSMLRELSPRSQAYLASFGERLSARLLAEILKTRAMPAIQLDSFFLRTLGESYWEDQIDWEKTTIETKYCLDSVFKNRQIPVITGFFGKNPDQEISLLGRRGSDFSAAIFAKCLGINVLEIWTGVAGFTSADPTWVPEAKTLPEMGYAEVSELCFFGARIFYPRCICPVIENNGEVWVKNIFEPKKIGTKITKEALNANIPIQAVGSKPVVLFSLDVFRSKFRYKYQLLPEIFLLLKSLEIPIDALTSSESIISFCTEVSHAENQSLIPALEALAPLEVKRDRTIICTVSPFNGKGVPGLSAKIFTAIAQANINIEMYSQDASEISQLLVVESAFAEKAVQAIHRTFTN